MYILIVIALLTSQVEVESSILDGLADVTQNLGQSIGNGLSSGLDTTSSLISAPLTTVGQILNGTGCKTISDILNGTGNLTGDLSNKTVTIINSTFLNSSKTFSDVLRNTGNVTDGLVGLLGNGSSPEDVANSAGNLVKNLTEGVVNNVGDISAYLTDVTGTVLGDVGDIVTKTINNTGDSIQSLLGGITTPPSS